MPTPHSASTTAGSDDQPIGQVEIVTRLPMVRWMAPGQLLRTALDALLAGVFGRFADARATQALAHDPAHNPPIVLAPRAEGPVWIDYLADTGDGWNPTATIAAVVAAESLALPSAPNPLPRGDALILGGDQVYPTPADDGYRKRFRDAFANALPAPIAPRPAPGGAVTPGAPSGPVAQAASAEPAAAADPPFVPDADRPLLLAIPGNHDWYDGLADFTRIFCARLGVGRWRSWQKTSWFAVELPAARCWIWGVDLQLQSRIDPAQYDYFRLLAERLGPDDRVLVFAPEPSWIDESLRRDRQRRDAARRASRRPLDRARNALLALSGLASIDYQQTRFAGLELVENLVTRRGAQLAAVIAGDSHHFAHYAPTAAAASAATASADTNANAGTSAPAAPSAIPPAVATHRITCGGGGAFLLGTHRLPARLGFRTQAGEQAGVLNAAFPTPAESRRLRLGALTLVARAPSFGVFLATLYALWIWTLDGPAALFDRLRALPLSAELPAALWHATAPAWSAPAPALLTGAILAAAALFTRSGVKVGTGAQVFAAAGGAVHGLLHLTLALGAGWLALGGWLDLLPASVEMTLVRGSATALALGGAIGALIAGIGGATLTGAWMALTSSAFGWHEEEVFSSQAIEGFKSFLRIEIDAERITIHPLGLRRVCTRWKLNTDGGMTELARGGWLARRLGGGDVTRLRAVDIGGRPAPRFVPDAPGGMAAALAQVEPLCAPIVIERAPPR